ncbi:MAG: SDR family NAD(P)-dependent oxidoreductase [Lachnospiraceae bacterium]|nr:SDR family NAD(P)-dependent oxidoreductase [Lachnospiraceae bacterium]
MDKRVALITGASSGMGYETALSLLKEGVTVYGAARRLERMKKLEEKGVHILSLDVTDESSIKACVNYILEKESRIDILVNNAGYGSYGAVEDIPIEEVKRQFEVNVFGLGRLTQLVLPSMRKNNYGKIVNIASMGGRLTAPYGTWYHATKYAVEAFSDGLRMDLVPFNIDVIVIEPGMIKTAWGMIAASNLRKESVESVYQENAIRTAEYLEKMYQSKSLTEPAVIAKVITKAVMARKPKTRYLVGYCAKPYVFIRHITTDRMFDRLSFLFMGLKYRKG